MKRRLGDRPALDGIRAIAIVAVMGLHAIARVFPGGFYGVDIFFVLSAFLITTLIMQELEARDGAYDFFGFYARRALRLAPALVLWLAFLAAPTAVAIGQAHLIPIGTIASLLYVGDFAAAGVVRLSDAYVHVWSLAIEEQFYLLWPAALVWLAARRSGADRLRGLVAVVPLVFGLQLAAEHLLGGSDYFLPTGHLLAIVIGCLAAHAFAYSERASDRASPIVGAGAIVVLVVIICGYRQPGVDVGVLYSLVVALAAGLLVLHATSETPSPIGRLLANPVALWLGTRSYGLYLYHRTLTILIPALIPGITLRVAGPLGLAAAFVIAEASYRLVERPIRRAGRARLGRGSTAAPAAAG